MERPPGSDSKPYPVVHKRDNVTGQITIQPPEELDDPATSPIAKKEYDPVGNMQFILERRQHISDHTQKLKAAKHKYRKTIEEDEDYIWRKQRDVDKQLDDLPFQKAALLQDPLRMSNAADSNLDRISKFLYVSETKEVEKYNGYVPEGKTLLPEDPDDDPMADDLAPSSTQEPSEGNRHEEFEGYEDEDVYGFDVQEEVVSPPQRHMDDARVGSRRGPRGERGKPHPFNGDVALNETDLGYEPKRTVVSPISAVEMRDQKQLLAAQEDLSPRRQLSTAIELQPLQTVDEAINDLSRVSEFDYNRARELALLVNSLASNKLVMVEPVIVPKTVSETGVKNQVTELSATNAMRMERRREDTEAMSGDNPRLLYTSHSWQLKQETLDAILLGKIDLTQIAVLKWEKEQMIHEMEAMKRVLDERVQDNVRTMARASAIEEKNDRYLTRARVRRQQLVELAVGVQQVLAKEGKDDLPGAGKQGDFSGADLSTWKELRSILLRAKELRLQQGTQFGAAGNSGPLSGGGGRGFHGSLQPTPVYGKKGGPLQPGPSDTAIIQSIMATEVHNQDMYNEMMRDLQAKIDRRRRRRAWERQCELRENAAMEGEDVLSTVGSTFNLGDQAFVQIRDVLGQLTPDELRRFGDKIENTNSVFAKPSNMVCPCCKMEFDPAQPTINYIKLIMDRKAKAKRKKHELMSAAHEHKRVAAENDRSKGRGNKVGAGDGGGHGGHGHGGGGGMDDDQVEFAIMSLQSQLEEEQRAGKEAKERCIQLESDLNMSKQETLLAEQRLVEYTVELEDLREELHQKDIRIHVMTQETKEKIENAEKAREQMRLEMEMAKITAANAVKDLEEVHKAEEAVYAMASWNELEQEQDALPSMKDVAKIMYMSNERRGTQLKRLGEEPWIVEDQQVGPDVPMDLAPTNEATTQAPDGDFAGLPVAESTQTDNVQLLTEHRKPPRVGEYVDESQLAIMTMGLYITLVKENATRGRMLQQTKDKLELEIQRRAADAAMFEEEKAEMKEDMFQQLEELQAAFMGGGGGGGAASQSRKAPSLPSSSRPSATATPREPATPSVASMNVVVDGGASGVALSVEEPTHAFTPVEEDAALTFGEGEEYEDPFNEQKSEAKTPRNRVVEGEYNAGLDNDGWGVPRSATPRQRRRSTHGELPVASFLRASSPLVQELAEDAKALKSPKKGKPIVGIGSSSSIDDSPVAASPKRRVSKLRAARDVTAGKANKAAAGNESDDEKKPRQSRTMAIMEEFEGRQRGAVHREETMKYMELRSFFASFKAVISSLMAVTAGKAALPAFLLPPKVETIGRQLSPRAGQTLTQHRLSPQRLEVDVSEEIQEEILIPVADESTTGGRLDGRTPVGSNSRLPLPATETKKNAAFSRSPRRAHRRVVQTLSTVPLSEQTILSSPRGTSASVAQSVERGVLYRRDSGYGGEEARSNSNSKSPPPTASRMPEINDNYPEISAKVGVKWYEPKKKKTMLPAGTVLPSLPSQATVASRLLTGLKETGALRSGATPPPPGTAAAHAGGEQQEGTQAAGAPTTSNVEEIPEELGHFGASAVKAKEGVMMLITAKSKVGRRSPTHHHDHASNPALEEESTALKSSVRDLIPDKRQQSLTDVIFKKIVTRKQLQRIENRIADLESDVSLEVAGPQGGAARGPAGRMSPLPDEEANLDAQALKKARTRMLRDVNRLRCEQERVREEKRKQEMVGGVRFQMAGKPRKVEKQEHRSRFWETATSRARGAEQ